VLVLAILTLSGVDGAGKSTLARYLYHYFSHRGSSHIFWLCGSHLLALLLLRLLSRFRLFKGFYNPYYNVCIPVGLRSLLIHMEFWPLIPYIFIRRILGLAYGFLVSDRAEPFFMIVEIFYILSLLINFV
jgi:hypothetical protein